MARKPARKRAVAAADQAEQGSPALDKIAGLLALIATHDMETDAAAVRLGGVGFSDREISGLIGVTEGYVRLARFRAKSKKRRKRKA
jgi:hypothetical protein